MRWLEVLDIERIPGLDIERIGRVRQWEDWTVLIMRGLECSDAIRGLEV